MLRQVAPGKKKTADTDLQREAQSLLGKKAKEGELVWIPDTQEGFVLAEVIESLESVAVVKTPTADGRDWKRIAWNQIFPRNPENQDGEPDNTALMHLHDAALLHNIRYRYEHDNIYTYTAGILIVVNPYKDTRQYSLDTMMEYKGKSVGVLPPHVFAVADRAFRSMKALHVNQSIIVSGESGAGKTETCKHVIRYLTAISSASAEDVADGAQFDERSLERQILETNQILESFGNALTIRNDNSSRFGKFSELTFDSDNRICGASIETYLLEKSRVVYQNTGERNYHSFYQLIKGAPPDMLAKLHLDDTDFHYLTHSNPKSGVDHGIDDATGFRVTSKALEIIGLNADEREDLWRVVAGVLHTGNIEFSQDRQDRAYVKEDTPASRALDIAAELLQLDRQSFEKRLITRTLRTGRTGEKAIVSPLDAEKATFSRDALAKDIYGRLFDWLVRQLNTVLVPDRARVAHHIGILDIFGFEVMEHNSFEQLCINHANERLQLFFNSQVLQQEMELYEREGIQFEPIKWEDNRPTLTLVEEARTGILSMLDEECQLPKGTDKKFTEKVHMNHARHPSLAYPRQSKRDKSARRMRDDEGFLIKTFAGEVVYETDGFLIKNNDALLADLEDMMQTTDLMFLQKLFPPASESTTTSKAPKKFKSIGTKFSIQLQNLLTNLGQTSSHFVRCIKPNVQQKPGIFQGENVMEQLRCSGMLECLILMHMGYPTRCNIDDLHTRYRDLLPEPICSLQPSEFCEALLVALDVDRREFQLGITKVFLRAGQLARLEELNSSEYMSIAQDVVEKVRRWISKKKLKRAIWSIVAGLRFKRTLQCLRARDRVSRFSIMVFLISQTWVKLAREVKQRTSARRIQATYRMFVVRRHFLEIRKEATKIQSVMRGYLIFHLYLEERRALKEEREEKKRQLEEEDRRRKEEEKRRREEAKRKREQDAREARERQIEEDKRKAKERLRRMEEKWAKPAGGAAAADADKPSWVREREAKEKAKADARAAAATVAAAATAAEPTEGAKAVEPEVVEVAVEDMAVEAAAKPVVAPAPALEGEVEAEVEAATKPEVAATLTLPVTPAMAEALEALRHEFEQTLETERTRREEESVKAAKVELRMRKMESELKALRLQLQQETEDRKSLAKQVADLKQTTAGLSRSLDSANRSPERQRDDAMFAKLERLGLRVKGRERSSSMQVGANGAVAAGRTGSMAKSPSAHDRLVPGARLRPGHRPTQSMGVALMGMSSGTRERSSSTDVDGRLKVRGQAASVPLPVPGGRPPHEGEDTEREREREEETQKTNGMPSAMSLLGKLAGGIEWKPRPAPPKPAPLLNREALNQLRTAVEKLRTHFDVATDKALAGDDERDRKIVGLVRGGLCTAIAKIFSWGFNSFKIFGRYHVLDVFEGLQLEGPAGSAEYSLARAIAVVAQVHQGGTGSKDVRYRSIICKGLNERRLHEWFQLFTPETQAIIDKLFQPYSFLHVDELRHEISIILEPLKDLPFSMSLDFEIRRWDV